MQNKNLFEIFNKYKDISKSSISPPKLPDTVKALYDKSVNEAAIDRSEKEFIKHSISKVFDKYNHKLSHPQDGEYIKDLSSRLCDSNTIALDVNYHEINAETVFLLADKLQYPGIWSHIHLHQLQAQAHVNYCLSWPSAGPQPGLAINTIEYTRSLSWGFECNNWEVVESYYIFREWARNRPNITFNPSGDLDVQGHGTVLLSDLDLCLDRLHDVYNLVQVDLTSKLVRQLAETPDYGYLYKIRNKAHIENIDIWQYLNKFEFSRLLDNVHFGSNEVWQTILDIAPVLV